MVYTQDLNLLLAFFHQHLSSGLNQFLDSQ